MGAYYGIDLGTSQCLMAMYQKNPITDEDELFCVNDHETGEDSLPSVVSFISKNQYITGNRALNQLNRNPDSSVELVKMRLGRSDSISVTIPGEGCKEISPQEIASYLLKSLIASRQRNINTALLTVPAFFNQDLVMLQSHILHFEGYEFAKFLGIFDNQGRRLRMDMHFDQCPFDEGDDRIAKCREIRKTSKLIE